MSTLKEDRLLLGIGVDELSEYLNAKVLCCSESMSGVVENLMIGVLSVDSGIDYFSLKNNKAVIARSDRPDVQMAALATSTKCLIITGKTTPVPQVLNFAQEKRIPVLSVKQDVLTVVKEIEEAFLNNRFQQKKR